MGGDPREAPEYNRACYSVVFATGVIELVVRAEAALRAASTASRTRSPSDRDLAVESVFNWRSCSTLISNCFRTMDDTNGSSFDILRTAYV